MAKQNFNGGTKSRFWHFLTKKAVIHPLMSLMIVLGILIPIALQPSQTLNYDTTAELKKSLPSMIGFRTIQKHFSKGTAEPTTLYIVNKQKLDNQASLRIIDQLTKQLKEIKGVKTVLSVTQPGGTALKDLYVDRQLRTVHQGLQTANKGMDKIQTGLLHANTKIQKSNGTNGV